MMKRFLITIAIAGMLQACGGSGEKGTINDGFEGAGDANGALQDTSGAQLDPATDTSRQENRVDLQQRNRQDTGTQQ